MNDSIPVRRLEFDTELFGHGVAILDAPSASASRLRTALDQLRASSVRLVYWPCAPTEENDAAANSVGGFLVDRRTTFFRPLEPAVEPWPPGVETYEEDTANAELESLAIASAEQSRFRVDPSVPRDVGDTLYRRWIANSVAGRIADATFVVRDENSIVGMATVAEKNGRSDVGLIAVDARHRGRAHGTRLMDATHHWARQRGLSTAQVVTQGANTGARRLYENCGYEIEQVENYYHFWLPETV